MFSTFSSHAGSSLQLQSGANGTKCNFGPTHGPWVLHGRKTPSQSPQSRSPGAPPRRAGSRGACGLAKGRPPRSFPLVSPAGSPPETGRVSSPGFPELRPPPSGRTDLPDSIFPSACPTLLLTGVKWLRAAAPAPAHIPISGVKGLRNRKQRRLRSAADALSATQFLHFKRVTAVNFVICILQ